VAKIVAVAACPTGIAHTFMAAESLKRAAQALGDTIKVETQGSVGIQNPLTAADIAEADAVIIAADIKVDLSRFAGKPIYETSSSAAINDGQAVVRTALAEALSYPLIQAPPPPASTSTVKIVAITSCPTGIAHTFMAAEGLQQGAKALGHTIKVETQGSVGAQNTLTEAEIAEADVVVIAADTKVDLSRFAGKPIYQTSTNAAINDGKGVIIAAVAQAMASTPAPAPAGAATRDYVAEVQAAKARRAASATGVYKHLMTGVSYMIPFVVAGGIMIAVAFAVGGISTDTQFNALGQPTTLGGAFFDIGAKAAFALFVPILSGFIAYSIADRPGLAPGMVGGVLALSLNAGFLGGIISGFIAGYTVYWLNRGIRLPRNLAGLMPVLVLPVLGTVITGLLMIYVVGPPVSLILAGLTHWLTSLPQSDRLLLGMLLGAMMGFDMGGPVNKSAYAFAVGLLASHIYVPMAAVMAAGMTPPLGLALATVLFKNRFTADEQEAGKAAWALGVSFITEGAIPFAARDPFRVIPANMIGSAVAGGLSAFFGCQLRVPHGGIFVLPIPNAVSNLPMYIVAIVAGTLVSTAVLFVLKRPLTAASPAAIEAGAPVAA
jgi:PTS system fructose-specific IIC component